MAKTFSLVNTTRHSLPGVPFSVAAKKVLGVRYDLSVVIVPPAHMKKLNRAYRNKNESTDVLAFPLEKQAGELYLSIPDVKKKAKLFGMAANDYLKYLYIHGLVHLKGYDHGRKMDALEKKYCRLLKFPFPKDA